MVRCLLPCFSRSSTPDDQETGVPSVIGSGKFILSLAYQYSLATLYAPHVTSDGSLQCLPSRPQNHHYVYSPHGMSPIQCGFCIITSSISLPHTMVGSTPSNVFVPRPKLYARYGSLYTRDLNPAGYDFPRDWHWLVTSKPIVIPYHLLTCRSFPPVYIQLLHFGLGHHEVNHHYIYSIPHIQFILHPSRLFFSLSIL
jgi:hypothetical protein